HAGPGDPAPWADLEPESRALRLVDVRTRCAGFSPPRPLPGNSPTRPAAVLVALFADDDGEARVILTQRPHEMSEHRGEVAFPGGKVDPVLDASHRQAALREAHEEIGIEPASVEVVAELDAIHTYATDYAVSPFVGILPGRPALRPDPREVARAFDL